MESKNVCNLYERILKRGRSKQISMEGLQGTIAALKNENNSSNDEKASTKEFKEIVQRRSFNEFGHRIRSERIPNSGEEVLIS